MNITYTIDEVEQVANKLILQATSRTLLFYGDMGVGKTTLIKAIVKGLGSKDDVSSPTFSIVNEYELKDEKIFHFDLYRINDLEEAYNFGIEDYLDSDNWIIIEWPDVIEPILSGNECIIKLSIQSENMRQLIAD
ncbi:MULTISPECIES: tRNA (adenosine(37)-N6)-threonylcarbamoyltransferase complex ATPase subunit type 1 TsaE [unclassified Algibacter]|uniref:tRNA (adenosine(37)-N6)-threonylcarbamoyltransferase complex ATPase subunit type 1 TsaE n=1 Tax=unclassified Algibacter TaxID=2615009 RepID=UPI00131DA9EF|nr:MULTISPECIES: tRNA (adenosine(37)-N6)-threonylcarbamoyltransferase complex ATPase subunit type 1 TsaE [unclassified Algibacter]MCL5127835.1 tRNA (adenosine(37)-N6)-threonylcarbamoyltransferase complex ATPase subunit type 1 TsaE [Algibacter sp. L4_22]